MTLTVEVSISDELASDAGELSDDDVPEPELLQSWAEAAYLGETPAVASLLVTTADEVQSLNKQYRNKDKPTNVLSFPMESPAEIDVSLLGDIVLCAPVIKQEAEQQSRSEVSHWAHMVVHGMLHLQGYDHIENHDAEQMEQLEIEILSQLGFDNPYEDATEK
ncbi:MAG: rRNA maturation RNase YbeY [Gammaproteobacteria bacterium]|jgi:probable rRNA maturation factor|nr:rRNA maturation RNase YbeY [Gammaproteobacteria bacterium]